MKDAEGKQLLTRKQLAVSSATPFVSVLALSLSLALALALVLQSARDDSSVRFYFWKFNILSTLSKKGTNGYVSSPWSYLPVLGAPSSVSRSGGKKRSNLRRLNLFEDDCWGWTDDWDEDQFNKCHDSSLNSRLDAFRQPEQCEDWEEDWDDDYYNICIELEKLSRTLKKKEKKRVQANEEKKKKEDKVQAILADDDCWGWTDDWDDDEYNKCWDGTFDYELDPNRKPERCEDWENDWDDDYYNVCVEWENMTNKPTSRPTTLHPTAQPTSPSSITPSIQPTDWVSERPSDKTPAPTESVEMQLTASPTTAPVPSSTLHPSRGQKPASSSPPTEAVTFFISLKPFYIDLTFPAMRMLIDDSTTMISIDEDGLRETIGDLILDTFKEMDPNFLQIRLRSLPTGVILSDTSNTLTYSFSGDAEFRKTKKSAQPDQNQLETWLMQALEEDSLLGFLRASKNPILASIQAVRVSSIVTSFSNEDIQVQQSPNTGKSNKLVAAFYGIIALVAVIFFSGAFYFLKTRRIRQMKDNLSFVSPVKKMSLKSKQASKKIIEKISSPTSRTTGDCSPHSSNDEKCFDEIESLPPEYASVCGASVCIMSAAGWSYDDVALDKNSVQIYSRSRSPARRVDPEKGDTSELPTNFPGSSQTTEHNSLENKRDFTCQDEIMSCSSSLMSDLTGVQFEPALPIGISENNEGTNPHIPFWCENNKEIS